jgi:hypothetical protein
VVQRRLSWSIGCLLIATWLAYWLISGRYAMLDDCFIHLRYADFLLKTHTITYDGVHRSFGTSSPLYVTVLALLRPLFRGPLLPKGLSVCFYLGLICLLVTKCMRQGQSTVARILLILLIFCFASPMGIRWLTDGMETPFHILFVVLLALLVDREMQRETISLPRTAVLILFGFLMTTLRIESASLLFLVSLAIFLSRAASGSSTKVSVALRSLPLGLGSVLAMLTIRLTLGYFLPDTALAKTGAASLKPLGESAHLLLSSLTLGIGVFVLWLLSAALLLRGIALARTQAPPRSVIVVCNAILPLTIVLACLRGQFVQGIRYLLGCMVFSTLWNILQIEHIDLAKLSHSRERTLNTLRTHPWPALTLASLLLLALLPVEVHFVRPTLKGRGATFTELRATPLSLLRNDRIMSADVGYVGYFSGADLCDVEGLVDGRAFAAKTKPERIRACATSSPDVLFLNDFQLAEAGAFTDLSQWSVCRTYDFAGVTINDRHYLMVPQSRAASMCPALGGKPTPYFFPAASEVPTTRLALNKDR